MSVVLGTIDYDKRLFMPTLLRLAIFLLFLLLITNAEERRLLSANFVGDSSSEVSSMITSFSRPIEASRSESFSYNSARACSICSAHYLPHWCTPCMAKCEAVARFILSTLILLSPRLTRLLALWCYGAAEIFSVPLLLSLDFFRSNKVSYLLSMMAEAGLDAPVNACLWREREMTL